MVRLTAAYGALLALALAACSAEAPAPPETPEVMSIEAAPRSVTTPTPETLDAQGVSWFDTYCGTLTGLRTTMQAVATPTGFDVSTPVAYQAGLAQTYYGAADAFTAAGTTLTATPAPDFSGAAAFADEVAIALTTLGTTLRTQVDAFAATPVVDLASVEAANQTLATTFQASVTQLAGEIAGALPALPPAIRSAVRDIPSCSLLGP